MSEMETQKKKLDLVFRECMIISDFFIETYKRRGGNVAFSVRSKEHLMMRYEKCLTDDRPMGRRIDGFRQALNDLKEEVRMFLTKEEQADLKQRIREQLGPDME